MTFDFAISDFRFVCNLLVRWVPTESEFVQSARTDTAARVGDMNDVVQSACLCVCAHGHMAMVKCLLERFVLDHDELSHCSSLFEL